jgi:hypothetical protein
MLSRRIGAPKCIPDLILNEDRRSVDSPARPNFSMCWFRDDHYRRTEFGRCDPDGDPIAGMVSIVANGMLS